MVFSPSAQDVKSLYHDPEFVEEEDVPPYMLENLRQSLKYNPKSDKGVGECSPAPYSVTEPFRESLSGFAALGLTLGLRNFAQPCRRFAASLVAGLFIMLVRAGLFKNAALHRHFLETSQSRFDTFTRLDSHLCQMDRSFPDCSPKRWSRARCVNSAIHLNTVYPEIAEFPGRQDHFFCRFFISWRILRSATGGS